MGNLCYAGLADVAAYLNRPDVLAALGVRLQYVSNWSSCDGMPCCGLFSLALLTLFTGLVYQDIATPDWFKQEEYVVPFLLDSYKVLIYNGMVGERGERGVAIC